MTMPDIDIDIGRTDDRKRRRMIGFSLVELVIALVVVSILTAISVPYLYQYKKRYKSEDQAIKIMDLMREAGQLALTKRRTIQLDIDLSVPARPVLRLSDPSGATDLLAKTIPLEPMNEIRMDLPPLGVTAPNPPNYANAAFVGGVWSFRFKSDGSVVDTGGIIPISRTLYIWPPKTVPYNAADLTPRAGEVRAITIFGGSGAVRYWKYDGAAFLPIQ